MQKICHFINIINFLDYKSSVSRVYLKLLFLWQFCGNFGLNIAYHFLFFAFTKTVMKVEFPMPIFFQFLVDTL